jgi:hypothetical protein
METLKKIFEEELDPVGRDTHPNLACVIGFLFGGVGLAIYFRTVVDLVFPVVITVFGVIAYSALGGLGWITGAIVAALYGYYRSVTSNRRRAAAHPQPAVVAGS